MKTSIKSLLASVRINAVLLLIINAVTGLLLASALTSAGSAIRGWILDTPLPDDLMQ